LRTIKKEGYGPLEAIIHGIVLSFGLILPLGVQNVFIFSQGATQPKLRKALPATVTASICDTLLILSAIFGMSAVVFQIGWLRTGFMTVGILFLLYMGFAIWKAEPRTNDSNTALTPRKQIVFALSVSLLNPHAIIDTVGVIGTSALRYSGPDQAYFAAACIFVSWIWFLGLTIAGAMIKRLEHNAVIVKVFNKCSALFIWGTALYLLIGLIP
jgi:L-lysine exporter family protein LysE/ArgO